MKPSPAVSVSVQEVQTMTLSNPMGWVYAFSFASVFWMVLAMLVFAATHPPLFG